MSPPTPGAQAEPGPPAAPSTPAAPLVVVVGSVNVDVSTAVARHPQPGETVLATGQTRSFGGKGANQAVAAARAGVAVAFVGAVGDDADGHDSLANLGAVGVDVSAVAVVDDRPTGAAYITVSADGENTIVVAAGANADLCPAHIDAHAELITSATAVVVQLEIPVQAVQRVLAHTDRVVLNAAPARDLSDEVLAAVDVLIVNETEARTMTHPDGTEPADLSPTELLTGLRALGPRAVVMTLGAAGAAWADDVDRGTVQAPQVQVVDTTGAGDVFVGVFAAAYARGEPMDACVRRAVAVASRATTVAGAQPSFDSTGADLPAITAL